MASRIEGGDKLAAHLRDLSAKLGKSTTVDVGFLAGATYPDGKPVALIAAIQEFGAPARNIPPRPFFRSMIAAKSGEWPEGIATQLRAHDYDATAALTATGAAVKGQLQQAIADYDAGPPLKPATIAKKGFDKALIDTGHMMNSVDFDVT